MFFESQWVMESITFILFFRKTKESIHNLSIMFLSHFLHLTKSTNFSLWACNVICYIILNHCLFYRTIGINTSRYKIFIKIYFYKMCNQFYFPQINVITILSVSFETYFSNKKVSCFCFNIMLFIETNWK